MPQVLNCLLVSPPQRIRAKNRFPLKVAIPRAVNITMRAPWDFKLFTTFMFSVIGFASEYRAANEHNVPSKSMT
jgi:hypothetical protein